MPGEHAETPVSSHDASRNGLEFAQRLVAAPSAPGVAELLVELAAAFGADGAAVAAFTGGPPLLRRSSLAPASHWPWDVDANLYLALRTERSARSLPHPEGGTLLAAAALGLGQTPWLIWLESRRRSSWNAAESAAFALAAAAIARTLDVNAPRWSEQLERLTQQQQLEQAALAVRRVAHDYGNVLTTILGFGELALAQQAPAGSPIHRYLTEVRSGAESGAQLTNQLRLFSRRQTSAPRPCPLQPILTEEQTKLQNVRGGTARIELILPPELPPAAIDGDNLRIIVRALLDNALEATDSPGTVTVTARSVAIAAEECLDYFGDVQPGLHVEIRIADAGPGLTADVRRRLFAEPFFSTKPRRRGYGLCAVYGVLRSHKGGLRLSNGPERGAVARVVLPIAVVPAAPVAPSAASRATGDKILIVCDGDPLKLRALSGTLTKAGYRVQCAANAEKALAVHAANSGESFRVVVSDAILPSGSGVELARRLLKRDAELRVVFMTERASGQEVPRELAGRAVELLPKPFRPEELLRAVRTVLEGGPLAQRTAVPREESIVSSSR